MKLPGFSTCSCILFKRILGEVSPGDPGQLCPSKLKTLKSTCQISIDGMQLSIPRLIRESVVVLGRRSFLVLITNLTSASLSFVGLLVLTRSLGAETYGTISFTLALVTAFNAFSDLGFSSAHIRKLAEGEDTNDCVSSFIVIKVLLISITILITSAYVLVTSLVLQGNLNTLSVQLIVLFLLFYILYDIAAVAIATYTSTMEVAKAQIIVLANPLIRVPLIVVFAMAGLGAIEVAYAYVLAGIATLVVGFAFLNRDGVHWSRPTLIKSYWSFALPLSLIGAAGVIVISLDKLVIGFFYDQNEVAYYASGYFLIGVIAMIGVAVSTMTFPSFSRLHNAGNLEQIQRLSRTAEKYILMLGVPFATLIAVYPTEIAVIMFGQDFHMAGGPLRYLGLFMVFFMLNELYSSQILAFNRPGVYARLTAVQYVIFLALLLFLVPKRIFEFPAVGLSSVGAALATLMASAVTFFMRRGWLRRIAGFKWNLNILVHLLSSFVLAISLKYLSTILELDDLADLVFYTLFSLLVFGSLMTATRQLLREDVRYFLEIVNLRKLGEYVSSEMRRREMDK